MNPAPIAVFGTRTERLVGLWRIPAIASSPRGRVLTAALAIAVVLGAEVAIFGDRLSLATDVGSAITGGNLAMFGSLFASREPALKPMQMTHVARVVAVIGETDEDDAPEAEQGFLKGALDGMFA